MTGRSSGARSVPHAHQLQLLPLIVTPPGPGATRPLAPAPVIPPVEAVEAVEVVQVIADPATTVDERREAVLPLPPELRVEVVRSAKRRRTVSAQVVGDVLRLAIPSWMSTAEEAHWVDEMSARFRRQRSADRIDLVARAQLLARRHDLRRPREVRWADDMNARWGSCTPSTGVIRLSTRLAAFPAWVIDYVLVHELAHLDEPGHGERFWQLVHRYDRAERAIGYLMAKSGDAD
jgi:predicted metal-dependent hydrolase